ncbi:MAG: ACP S-malonyltransferase [Planctomycetota bacterium]|nr:ACP S-malonyltransferase [Planctomycetota bacterium]MDI6787633.1 ACP S-malonyltransferase [Planctomycetota bacterium]
MKIALLFPGQGAQFVGMGKKLYEQEPKAGELFQKANSILGFDLTKIIFEGPEEELNKTNICQPAILVTSIVAFYVMSAKGQLPDWSASAGLSLGEYTALVSADAISFEEALKIVERRGTFMQEDCSRTRSTMASVIGLDREKIKDICASVSGIVGIANINSPEQIVISGDVEAVNKAGELLKQAGAKKVIPLKVAGAFHSPLMKTAGTRLASELLKVNIKTPSKDVISNVTADYARTPEEIRSNLSRQVSNPVLWSDSMQKLIQDGYTTFYEIGPGKVLTGLIKRISDKVTTVNYEV